MTDAPLYKKRNTLPAPQLVALARWLETNWLGVKSLDMEKVAAIAAEKLKIEVTRANVVTAAAAVSLVFDAQAKRAEQKKVRNATPATVSMDTRLAALIDQVAELDRRLKVLEEPCQ